MATHNDRLNKFRRYYTETTGKKEVDMRELAFFAEKMGWTLPVPPSPIDLLARRFADAAREELRHDKETKRPYRAALSIRKRLPDGKQLHLWIDTDLEDRRFIIVKALNRYREQMVGEAVMGSNTADHWSDGHPAQKRIVFRTDLGPDVEWRRNAPEDDEKAG